MADDRHRRRVAVELHALHWTDALGDVLEGARIGSATPIYDVNGELLFERVPLTSDGLAGHADVAVHPAMGAVLLGVSPGTAWDEETIIAEARKAADDILASGGGPAPDTIRFVAYSLPKVAVQFLAGDQEVAMLELWSWQPVPPRRDRDPTEPPSHFERWSYLDELPAETLAAKQAAFEERVAQNEALPGRERLTVDLIERSQFADLVGGAGPGTAGPGPGTASAGPAPGTGTGDQRELHFSTRGVSHATCYEVQGQATPKWCVAASIQMLLDFYRYQYSQEGLAAALGLGTLAAPMALPNGQEDLVVSTLETMSSNALDATKAPSPTWNDFCAEIADNRPVISFIPGHARTVAGYKDSGPAAGLTPFQGLVVYDPLGPSGGGKVVLENVAFPVYTFAFTAQVHRV